jgi:hypothetical protein
MSQLMYQIFCWSALPIDILIFLKSTVQYSKQYLQIVILGDVKNTYLICRYIDIDVALII